MLIPAALMMLQASAPTMTPRMPTTALPIPRRKPAPSVPAAAPAPLVSSRLSACLAQAESDPAAALASAEAWGAAAKGTAAIDPAQCRGTALGELGRWSDAVSAFTLARDLEVLPERKARFGAMAGNAALAAGDNARADSLLAAAHADAAASPALAGDIAIDRARALFALGKTDAVAAALAEGRAASPGNANGWLLSATLARKQNRLAEAQGWIERAAALAPADPGIGLEAGVIAVLSGHDEAARRSWQSVIAAAPGSPQAATARGYLAQLAAPSPSKGP
ncbi:tetratricopeptide repeat protein [Parablastomonas sp. CN1-191]|uniref:tetratricopeptide repeat protein n=1 Tax=Parablastomonas sp. CN1-191 TaxID=3400908 RepID=UPI003BF7C4B3